MKRLQRGCHLYYGNDRKIFLRACTAQYEEDKRTGRRICRGPGKPTHTRKLVHESAIALSVQVSKHGKNFPIDLPGCFIYILCYFYYFFWLCSVWVSIAACGSISVQCQLSFCRNIVNCCRVAVFKDIMGALTLCVSFHFSWINFNLYIVCCLCERR